MLRRIAFPTILGSCVTLCVSLPTHSSAQRLDVAQSGFQLPATLQIASDSTQPLQLSNGCQVSRGVVIGLEGFLGYLIASIGTLPLELSDAPKALIVGVQAIGAIAGIARFVDEPLSRRLPFCPEAMRTVAKRPTMNHQACRASRMFQGALGAAEGSLIGIGLALPFVLTNSARDVVLPIALVGLPVTGAIHGVVNAGDRPPCLP